MSDFSFRKLNAYIVSKELVKSVYRLASTFPSNEQYALTTQLRRAVISIPSNLAEGMGRISCKEQIHFLEIAYGSLMEVLCQLEIALELQYINKSQFTDVELKIIEVARLLSGLRASITKKL